MNGGIGLEEEKEAEYYSKDFEWEELRSHVENDPSFSHHLLPFQPQPQPQLLQSDSHAWKRFHIRHSSGKFFKERRYLLKEFPELVSCKENSKVLEVGCGNGSTILPILRFPSWLACNQCRDLNLQTQQSCLSDVRINNNNKANSDDAYSLEGSGCCKGGVDFITLIFTLSAIPLQEMPVSIKECFSILKPGGLLLFRDYGLYDMTMLRFEKSQRVGFREYNRSDGTRSYFFSLDIVRDLFVGAGFTEVELDYCCINSVNRRKGKSMQRVWVHGKFQKPI
ncbi:uncharacterized protein LOC133790704 isoform X4 [Humulus lupulus]|uniref:uncharacterized protein LOC133790704 isoform X4 n=1 Tax=Humulus lupulus TaxID=3486 RepID=UPI002B402F0A|nr:uncharacterized protein LOC133790704 isoform X4 [Humulus lupulus]